MCGIREYILGPSCTHARVIIKLHDVLGIILHRPVRHRQILPPTGIPTHTRSSTSTIRADRAPCPLDPPLQDSRQHRSAGPTTHRTRRVGRRRKMGLWLVITSRARFAPANVVGIRPPSTLAATARACRTETRYMPPRAAWDYERLVWCTNRQTYARSSIYPLVHRSIRCGPNWRGRGRRWGRYDTIQLARHLCATIGGTP